MRSGVLLTPLFHSRSAFLLFHRKLKLLKFEFRKMNKDFYGDISAKTSVAFNDLCLKQDATLTNPLKNSYGAVSIVMQRWEHLASIEAKFYPQKSRVK